MENLVCLPDDTVHITGFVGEEFYVCFAIIRLFRADMFVVFFHTHFPRLAVLSSVDLTRFLGDSVKDVEPTVPGCPLQGSVLALSMLCLWGLCFH